MEQKYYDGAKLLSLKDLRGLDPTFYMCTSNRTGGKTTYFNRLTSKRAINGEKFALLNRFNYELDDLGGKFFKDVGHLFFPGIECESKIKAKGLYASILFDGVEVGYGLTLNNADAIKKCSHYFSDVEFMVFDEFQSETNHYCQDEIAKFISVVTSISRGRGKMIRRVPVYMIANPVSLLNPYYAAMGVTERLRDDTKFLRGNGWVLEQGYVKAAAEAQEQSGIAAAFPNETYTAYSSQAVYLNDSTSFVEKMSGRSSYVCTIRHNNKMYGVRFFPSGIAYCDDRPDATFGQTIAAGLMSHNADTVLMKTNSFLIGNLRIIFEQGDFRFKNQQCKLAVMDAIKY